VLELREIDDNKTLGLLNLTQFSRQHSELSKREIEKAGTLHLLEKMVGEKAQLLRYHSNRKPFLLDQSLHLSISHSHEWLAIFTDRRHETGVDIELVREKVLNVKDKFLSSTELLDTGLDVEKLITYWAVKESIYKVYGNPEVEFKRDIRVTADEGSNLKAELTRGSALECFSLRKEKIQDYILVYVNEKGEGAR